MLVAHRGTNVRTQTRQVHKVMRGPTVFYEYICMAPRWRRLGWVVYLWQRLGSDHLEGGEAVATCVESPYATSRCLAPDGVLLVSLAAPARFRVTLLFRFEQGPGVWGTRVTNGVTVACNWDNNVTAVGSNDVTE